MSVGGHSNSSLTELIDRAEHDIEEAAAPYAEVAAALGKLGAPLLAPLAARIDARTAGIDPKGGAQEQARRVVVYLRFALACALWEMARRGEDIDGRWDAYLRPEPFHVFRHKYTTWHEEFFRALGSVRHLFGTLPEERVFQFIEAWRATSARNIENCFNWMLPNERRNLLWGAPSLAKRIADAGAKTDLPCSEPVYVLEYAKKARAKSKSKTRLSSPLNRVGGTPKGLSDDRWPRDGRKLRPVLTLDLDTVPELKGRYDDARAITLMVDRPRHGFDSAAVVPLTEEECRAGIKGGKKFTVERVMVPIEAFTATPDHEVLYRVKQLLDEAPARALGYPSLLQSDIDDDARKNFVLQANEEFSDLNLGDAGELYVYTERAFWESL